MDDKKIFEEMVNILKVYRIKMCKEEIFYTFFLFK